MESRLSDMVESDRQDANKLLFDRVCLHCISYLETFNECEGVEFFSPRKAGPADFASWEKKNLPYKLPADLTSFYEMFDGFRLDFKTEVGSSVLTVGTMLLNSISDMERIPLEGNFPGMSDLSTMSSAGFALENKSEIGNIVLLYRSQEDKEKMLGSFNSATVLTDPPLLEHSPSSLGITADTAGEKQKDKDKLFESPEVWFQVSLKSRSKSNSIERYISLFTLYYWHLISCGVLH